MAYARPTALLSPGDIFPEIPFSVGIAPLRVAKRHGWTPPAGRGPAEFRRIYTLPQDQEQFAQLPNPSLSTVQGEETLAHTRLTKALFLTWGSQVESAERNIERTGRVGNRTWLAAPIYDLTSIPEVNTEEDPDTHEQVPLRDLIRRGKARDAFYLEPFPGRPAGEEHYAELRKITSIGVQYFLDAKESRIVTLTLDTLNEMYSQLLWCLTRADLFFHPIRCAECGRDVPIDVRFHGQNFDAEPI
jgi:hypothetical protein